MGSFERFLAQSIKDVGADDVVAALFGKVVKPTPMELNYHPKEDIEKLQAIIDAAAKAAQAHDGDVEVHIDYEE